MDNPRGFEEDRTEAEDDAGIGHAPEAPRAIGNDERRMHVRAYNHWVSLLDGKPFPSIAHLDPAGIADFGPHSVLIDFSGDPEDPRIAYLGRALREECALDNDVERIADVPSRSLLSRLTDHYLQIIANRAPVGFEAEFVNGRGRTTMYRGILMPFGADGDEIAYIYGVINWKELADAATQHALEGEVAEALAHAPQPTTPAPVWADGPGADSPVATGGGDSLFDRLADARVSAAEALSADGRSRAALYDALGRAHDFATAAEADPESYDEILSDTGIRVQARAPMTAVAKLVFGTDADKARLTEFATVLTHARRVAVPVGTLAQYLSATDGGMKAIVAAERAQRRGQTPAAPDATEAVDALPALASVRLPVETSEGYVLLLGRIAGDRVEVVADVTETASLKRALRRAA